MVLCSAVPVRQGVPMWGSSLEFEHVFPAVLLSVVVTCSARAQQVPPAIWSASQLPDAPSALARVPGPQPGSQKDLNLFASASTLPWMSSFGKGMQNRFGPNEHETHYAK